MRLNTTRERLLASTVLFGAAALAMSANAASAQAIQTAQNTTPAPAAGAEQTAPVAGAPEATAGSAVKEVVVTGSRIAQKGLTSASPLAVVNDQEIKLEGTTNVENLLNNLPQAFAAQTSSLSNGSTGTATVNLRDLGSQHTLVLVDGRRLMPGDPGSPSADLNNIPAQLVDRVEVTTGGASAIYGSDAVAGVVNFIMKHDFQGVRIDAQGGFAQHTNGANNSVDSAIAAFNVSNPQSAVHVPSSVVDGRTMDVTAIFGANTPDDKGNVTAYVEYRNMQPVTQDQYSYSACSISSAVTSTPHVADTHICAGSSNTQFGHFVVTSLTSPTGTSLAKTTATLGALGVNTGTLSDNPNGTNTFVPYSSALAFNFGPFNYIQREDDRYTGGYFAHYRVNDHADLYSDFMFADDHTVSAIAPSGLFQGVGANGSSTVAVNCNNPLLSASQASALCGTLAGTNNIANVNAAYRFLNGGAPRTNDLRHTDYKIDIGSKGELAPGWNYDAYLQYGTSILSEEYKGDVSLSHAQNALLLNANGTCVTGVGCAPLNIFNVNGLTPAAVNYVSSPGFQEGRTVEQVASASITGDLGQYGIKSPFATDGLGVAFGTEYRRENLSLNTDQEFTSGDLAGQGGPRIGNSGTFDVYELFGEGRMPLVQDKPFIKNLSLDGAYRFSQYSTAAGRTDTYEGQFTYNVDSNIGFRGGYSRAVRAPNINELFASQSIGNYSGTDPCAGTAPTASLAQCQRTGVTTATYGNIIPCPAGQCSQLTGGNTNLQSEKADTITLGAVFTPTFLRGFSLTVDWFDIKIDDLIVSGVGGAAVTLTQCLQTGAPIYCSLVHRDPNTGILFGNSGFITATKVNTGFERTEGIDVAANYHFRPTDWLNMPNVGAFDLSMQGTYTTEFIRQPVSGGGAYDCAGLYGSDHCGDPIPHWRHRARLTWSPPYPFTLSLQWRYIGSTDFDGNQPASNNFLHQTNFNAADAKLPAYNYVDFSATYRIKDGLTARFGVNNIADKDPPVVDSNNFPASGPSLGNGNTFPGVYDSLGRTFFFGITADF